MLLKSFIGTGVLFLGKAFFNVSVLLPPFRLKQRLTATPPRVEFSSRLSPSVA